MIKTALKTCAVAAALSGAAFFAAGPASADSHDHNHGTANNNNVSMTFIGGYGVTCGSVSMASNTTTNCNGNSIGNDTLEDYWP